MMTSRSSYLIPLTLATFKSQFLKESFLTNSPFRLFFFLEQHLRAKHKCKHANAIAIRPEILQQEGAHRQVETIVGKGRNIKNQPILLVIVI